MAGDRYLIGTGARNWNDPNIWSLTSGGAPYKPASGTEKITNAADREFSSDTGFWTKQSGCSINTGVFNLTNVAANQGIYKTILAANKSYKVSFEIISISSGAVSTWSGGNQSSSSNGSFNSVGVKTIYLVVASTSNLNIVFGSSINGTTATIDNISVQEVDTIAPDATTPCIFDQNSGVGDVTLNANASCASFNSVGLTQIVRVVSSVYTFSNYGDLTLNGTLSKFAFTGTAYYYQKGTGGITTNGNLFLALNRLYIDGVGITVTNLDDMALVGAIDIYLTNGTWNVNGKTFTSTGLFITAGGTKTLTLGASVFNIGTWYNGQATNFTMTSNTGTVNITTTSNIKGASTFYNLTLTGVNTMTARISCEANIVVSNNLTITGVNSIDRRIILQSDIIGTARTITCNGTVSASNVDFRDITLAGTCNKDLSAITGGSGDCGGNSGITFTTAQAQYFKKYASTANYGDAANWFSDLALTVAGRVPLPQDLGSKFLATSFDRTCTVTCNVPRIPCLDMSEVVNTVTWSLANAIEVYGSYVLGNSITQSGNFNLLQLGIGNFVTNLYNKSIYQLSFSRGTFTILSDLNLNRWIVVLNAPTVYFNGYNVTALMSFNTASGTANLYLGSGTFTSNRASTGDAIILAENVFCETSKFIFTGVGAGLELNLRLFGKTYNNIELPNSGITYKIEGSNTIAELIAGAGAIVKFTAGTTQTIAKATIGANVTLDCVTASTYTLALSDITTAENANIKGCIAPVSKFFAEANSVDSGSNTNVVFGDYFTPQEIILENRIN